jgi:nicotinamide riboside transporter PnuC
MDAPAPAAPTPGVPERFNTPAGVLALWFGILGPPTIWLARLKISYILVPYACWGWGMLPIHAVTLVTGALTTFAGWTAWRSWQHAGRSEHADGATVLHRARFLAMVGLLSAGFFLAVIAAEGLLNFLVDPCITGGRRVEN